MGTYSFNIFKLVNAGDDGMVVTDDDELYYRAFGYHGQGHFPSRSGAEIGNRTLFGKNYRMNELTGAVLVVQVRKLDEIIGSLHRIKARFRSQLEELPGLSFRKLNDPEGECSTLLTVILPKADVAERLAQRLGTATVSKSGWHVYSNMEQILGKKMSSEHDCPYACDCYPCRQEYRKGMLPRIDEILARSINLSVGVVDRGLGAGFGIHPRSTDAEIEEKAKEFTEAYKESTHA